MPKQIDKMLDQILQEQRNFEINDGDDMYGVWELWGRIRTFKRDWE